jgi:hypothetical protein
MIADISRSVPGAKVAAGIKADDERQRSIRR